MRLLMPLLSFITIPLLVTRKNLTIPLFDSAMMNIRAKTHFDL